MNNMLLRALTGGVYVVLILVCVLCGAGWFWGLMLLFTVLAVIELQQLLGGRLPMSVSVRLFDILVAVVILSAVIGVETYAVAPFWIYIAFVLAVMYIPARIVLAVVDHTENPARSTLYSLLTQAYITAPLAMLLIAYLIGGYQVVLATFIFIWVNDTGAYLAGISFGRHKLCERLSPKKTWEGFWGGFFLTVAAGAVTAWIIGHSGAAAFVIWIVYAACVSVFGTFGDLFESLIKRTLGVKDSGRIIPGHGGILDRIDSLLAVAPLTLIFSWLIILLRLGSELTNF